MKIGVANVDGIRTLVAPLDGFWVDISRAYHGYQRIIDYIDGQVMHGIEEMLARGLLTRSFLDRVFDFLQKPGMLCEYKLREEPTLLQPLRPNKIIAVGRNFRGFIEAGGYDVPDEPVFHAKASTVCIGPGTPIIVKERYGRVDHEGELAVLIGKHAQDVQPEQAREYIAGYTLLNDITARDIQRRDIERGYPWYRSKNLATFCPLGPVVALPEGLPWPIEIDIEVRVNGAVRQRANTREFLFDFPQLLSAVTQFIPLEPGDLLSTGTSEGSGPIAPGDIVEVSSPEIGALRNPVVSGGT
ncbi:MAG: fumarylacetoacetate hydrolase family protein [Candidatus Hydrogenedentes bacterium]|nr:fumarylacetoacetate hydrolase family protein [Candidatus Hydrogenedentota bacterium]